MLTGGACLHVSMWRQPQSEENGAKRSFLSLPGGVAGGEKGRNEQAGAGRGACLPEGVWLYVSMWRQPQSEENGAKRSFLSLAGKGVGRKGGGRCQERKGQKSIGSRQE